MSEKPNKLNTLRRNQQCLIISKSSGRKMLGVFREPKNCTVCDSIRCSGESCVRSEDASTQPEDKL